MDTYFYNFVQALPDCERLAQKYGLERCLAACKDLCDALDSDSEELFGTDDECLRSITREAMAKFGARNMYAAFLYLSGNVEAAELHLQAHRFIAERAMLSITEILKRQN
ncbi:MAG: hypothetical protein VKN72_19705 [Nostocales cyanobacterium 94392]|nr:hypothetical protein [Nostocales cyanobacterium 94392]